MTEEVLKDYFDGTISTDILYMDIESSEYKKGYDTLEVNVTPIIFANTFNLTPRHLLMLCNDAITNNLKLTHLTTISLALLFSDFFVWDTDTEEGRIVGDVINDWDSPEINFPLTLYNLKNWKIYLEIGFYNWDGFQRHNKN